MVKKIIICLFIFLIGCSKAVNNNVISNFEKEDIENIKYAYSYKYTSYMSQHVTEFLDIQEIDENGSFVELFRNRQEMGIQAINILKEVLVKAELHEIDKKTNGLVLFIVELDDKSKIYLYDNGVIVTIDKDLNSIIYDSSEESKKAVVEIDQLIFSFAEYDEKNWNHYVD